MGIRYGGWPLCAENETLYDEGLLDELLGAVDRSGAVARGLIPRRAGSHFARQRGENDMIIDTQILDELTAKAKESPRLRVAMDLRNSPDDQSQRMLNALEPGTVMPIHRHKGSSETCVCVRGHFEEYFYDSEGRLTETVDMVPGGGY